MSASQKSRKAFVFTVTGVIVVFAITGAALLAFNRNANESPANQQRVRTAPAFVRLVNLSDQSAKLLSTVPKLATTVLPGTSSVFVVTPLSKDRKQLLPNKGKAVDLPLKLTADGTYSIVLTSQSPMQWRVVSGERRSSSKPTAQVHFVSLFPALKKCTLRIDSRPPINVALDADRDSDVEVPPGSTKILLTSPNLNTAIEHRFDGGSCYTILLYSRSKGTANIQVLSNTSKLGQSHTPMAMPAG